jgi:serine/threonine protein kinase
LIENLFYAVKRLISYGYIHCDIKLDNIVISNTKRLRLIDFGLLQTEKNWYDVRMNFLFSDFYMKKQFIYPIEYDIMYSNNENLKNYKLKFDNYHETYTDHLKRYNPDPSVLKEFTDSLVVEDDPSLNSLHDIKKIKIFKDNKIHEKSDVFSIGAILIDISNNFLKPENDDDLEVVKLYTELMFGLLNFNPIKRLNINEAIKLVKQIKKYQKTDPFKTNKDSDELKIAVRDHSYSGSSYTYLIKKILNKLSREDLINCVLSNNN